MWPRFWVVKVAQKCISYTLQTKNIIYYQHLLITVGTRNGQYEIYLHLTAKAH